jgi:hypothetical protein
VSGDDGLSLSLIDDNSEGNDCYCELVLLSGNHYLCNPATNEHINLHNVGVIYSRFLQKSIGFVAVCGVMKTNMHASGTHDSDPWNCSQQALVIYL